MSVLVLIRPTSNKPKEGFLCQVFRCMLVMKAEIQIFIDPIILLFQIQRTTSFLSVIFNMYNGIKPCLCAILNNFSYLTFVSPITAKRHNDSTEPRKLLHSLPPPDNSCSAPSLHFPANSTIDRITKKESRKTTSSRCNPRNPFFMLSKFSYASLRKSRLLSQRAGSL